jgi:hypothetical protein
MRKILVAGGYGTVGRYVVSELTRLSAAVVIGGRDARKARAAARELGAEGVALDVNDESTWSDALEGVSVVVMCLLPASTRLAEHLVSQGIGYVDIAPAWSAIEPLTGFGHEAVVSGSRVVLGVGLAPGLSNLLAKQLRPAARDDAVRLALMLGMGEIHGADGLGWFLDNIVDDFDGAHGPVEPFMESALIDLGTPFGRRRAYRFDVADQFIVTRTLGFDRAESFFCYDSRPITRLVHLLRRVGAHRLLRSENRRRVAIRCLGMALRLSSSLRIGTDAYAVAADIGTESISASGNNNSLLTGQIAARVAADLAAGGHEPGVHFLEELYVLEDFDHLDLTITRTTSARRAP